MENKVENTKKVSSGWMTVMIVLGLLLLKVFTGIPFWWMLAVVILFTAITIIYNGHITPRSRMLATVMAIVFLLALGDSFLQANFPRSYGKKEVLKARTDQGISKWMGDKTVTQAKDIWEFQKTRAGQEFLSYYNELLADDETQEAADTLAGFKKAWDLDKKLREKEQPVNSTGSTLPASPRVVHLQPGDKPYFKLGPKEESDWQSLPSSSLIQCKFYSDGDFYIVFQDGSSTFVPKGGNTKICADQLRGKTFKIRADNQPVLVEIGVS